MDRGRAHAAMHVRGPCHVPIPACTYKKKGTMMTQKETHRHMVGGRAIAALLAVGLDSKGFTGMAL